MAFSRTWPSVFDPANSRKFGAPKILEVLQQFRSPARNWFYVVALGLSGFALAATSASAEAPIACHGRDLSHSAGLAEAEAKRADDLMNADGLLWRVDQPGVAPSYLFGTIHSTDDSAVAIAKRAAEKIDGAKVVATELGSLDAVAKANLAAAMLAHALDRDHDTLAAVPAKDRSAVEKLVADQGLPTAFAHHLKLWFLAVLTAMPACETKREALNLPEVDQYLAETAKAAGVKVVGLETADEQLDAFSQISPSTAAALLAVAARDPALNDDVYATMLKLYVESRPAEILPIADVVGDMTDAERAAQNEFTRVLLVGRNAVMAERAEPLLKQGGAFIAVGALHLVGEDGLVERLRKAGYTVTKLW